MVAHISDYLVGLRVLLYMWRGYRDLATLVRYMNGRLEFESESWLNTELCFLELPRNA